MNKTNKQNTNTFIDTENRRTAVRGKGSWGMGEKAKGLSKETKKPHRHRQQYGHYQRGRGVGAGRRG